MSYSEKNELRDWQEIINADASAFEQLYLSLYQKLYVSGFRLCADKELTKDCIQELFLEIWQKRFQLGKIDNISAYFHTALRRKIVKKLKKQANRRQYIEQQKKQENLPSYETLLIAAQDNTSRRKELNKAISQLSPQQSEMLKLRYFEEMSYDKIAEMTGKSRRTIYNQIFDAVKKLRKIL